MPNVFVNRQQATRPLLKSEDANKAKSGRETYRAGESWGTHTSLPCCVSKVSKRAWKTAIYAPRPTSSCRCKAPFCCISAYETALEPSYFNNLTSRLKTPLTAGKGR